MELVSAPLSPHSGLDPRRGHRLDAAYEESTLEESPRWRLAVFLESIRPSEGELALNAESAAELVNLAGFRDGGVKRVVQGLLILAGRGETRPLECLRADLNADAGHKPEVYRYQLEVNRAEFGKAYQAYESGGDRLKLTHCRAAWRLFMRENRAFFKSLFPASKEGRSRLDPLGIAAEVERLRERYPVIAEDGRVFHEELNRFNRLAEEVLSKASEIGETAALAEDKPRHRAGLDEALLAAARSLREGEEPNEPVEALASRLLVRLLEESPVPGSAGPLRLSVGVLLDHPDLLPLIPVTAARGVTARSHREDDLCGAEMLSDPVAAAAILLDGRPWPSDGEPTVQMLEEVMRSLPEWHVRLTGLLTAAQVASARRALDDRRDRALGILGRLNESWHGLEALASRWTIPIGRVVEAGRQAVDDPAIGEVGLLIAWLEAADREAAARLEAEVAHYRGRAGTSGAPDAILRSLDEKRYDEALRHLGEGDPGPIVGRRRRETAYRREAKARFPRPDSALKDVKGEAEPGLRGLWTSGKNPTLLRNDFLRFLWSTKKGSRSRDALTGIARYESNECRLPTQAIRDRIADLGRNPCYLPQLASFSDLILLSPSGTIHAPEMVRKTGDSVARPRENVLCVVLAPGITDRERAAMLDEFRRRRGVVASVLDDLDFCRLLNPGGEPPDPLLGFFEIVLEQQRCEALSPFAAQQGRPVAREMFVGRQEVANELSQTASYSRLFSGRKLGKTSLLKYVQQTWDKNTERKLPSGNTLRVLMLPSVGPDAREVVDQIRQQMADPDQLDYRPLPAGPDIAPADELVAMMDEFVRDRPDESLLVIIDEADTLIEEELEHFATKRERGLSFRMSRDIEGRHTDSAGLPRVRFLFSGYRVTNTSDGVWGNWGDTLRLSPLEPEDADELAAGPLARMGIDLGPLARVVSWRCGYQPAVLLKFGSELLAYLDTKTSPSSRDYIAVTPDDISQVVAVHGLGLLFANNVTILPS